VCCSLSHQGGGTAQAYSQALAQGLSSGDGSAIAQAVAEAYTSGVSGLGFREGARDCVHSGHSTLS
jgi:hypothetical protein